MAGLVWRLSAGFVLLGTVRLAWRLGPPLAAGALVVACWPSVLLAVLLRRRALPAAETRWPGWRPRWWLAGAGALLVALAALAAARGQPPWAQPRALAAGYLAGAWLAPLAVPVGVLPAPAAALYVGAAAPLFLGVGVVLAGLWPAADVVRAALSARGGRWSLRPGGQRGHRTTPNPNWIEAPPAPPVRLRPVSAQRVATAAYAETRWFTQALDGPELLSMLVGPAGAGKSELVWAALRAQYDGADFCGLPTTRPRRVLLLSEMGGATLQPALRRWGFYAEPAGRLDAIRLRLLPGGHAGALVDVLYAADVYRPTVVDGELRQVEWPAVVQAAGDLCARRGYDRVIVDSLGEWMGSDSNEAMLRTLGACRQLTHAGVGVTILHHTPRSDPRRPRGGTVIDAKLDVGYSVTGTAAGGAPGSRTDPVRRLEWFKTRFPELTPEHPLLLERVWAGPVPNGAGSPQERPHYRRHGEAAHGGPGAVSVGSTDRPAAAPAAVREPEGANATRVSHLPAPPPAPLAQNEVRVLTALRGAGRPGATTKALAAQTGLARQRVHEVLTAALIPRSLVRVEGYQDTPGGGPKASLYVAVPVAVGVPETARGRLRLVAPSPPAAAPALLVSNTRQAPSRAAASDPDPIGGHGGAA